LQAAFKKMDMQRSAMNVAEGATVVKMCTDELAFMKACNSVENKIYNKTWNEVLVLHIVDRNVLWQFFTK
jgi:hypothetical protein